MHGWGPALLLGPGAAGASPLPPLAAWCRAALDEDLFTSLAAEPGPASPAAQAALAAEPELPSAARSDSRAAAHQPPGSPAAGCTAAPALDAAAARGPQPPGAAAAPAPSAGRRKKVIRSRIGYARTAAPLAGAQASPAHPLGAALAAPPAAPHRGEESASAAPLDRQASDAGSVLSQGSGSLGPAQPAGSRPASGAGQLAPDAQLESAHGSTAAASAAGSLDGSARGDGGGAQSARSGDPQHLTALQQHVARLNIQLEPPARAAGPTALPYPAISQDSSRRSTRGCSLAGRSTHA